MHIIARSALVKFWEGQPRGTAQAAARSAMIEWHTTTSDADWGNCADLKATFNTADYVRDGKVVFDVGGNKFRIVALIGFRTRRVFILFVGTPAQYDRIKVSDL